MATRGTIAVQLADGKVMQIYSHWDNYLEHNGRLLQEHYNSQELAEELVSLGDLSSLRERIHPTAPLGIGHSFDKPEPGVTIYYGRDRGEKGVAPTTYDNYEMYRLSGQREEYNYLFADGAWHVSVYEHRKIWTPLAQALESIDAEEEAAD